MRGDLRPPEQVSTMNLKIRYCGRSKAHFLALLLDFVFTLYSSQTVMLSRNLQALWLHIFDRLRYGGHGVDDLCELV